MLNIWLSLTKTTVLPGVMAVVGIIIISGWQATLAIAWNLHVWNVMYTFDVHMCQFYAWKDFKLKFNPSLTCGMYNPSMDKKLHTENK